MKLYSGTSLKFKVLFRKISPVLFITKSPDGGSFMEKVIVIINHCKYCLTKALSYIGGGAEASK